MSRIPLVLDCDPGHDDAVAVAHLAVPDLVQTVPYRVDVETTSELTRGRTVVDLHGLTELPANAEVGVAIDRPLRYVALGDSYTIGTSVDRRSAGRISSWARSDRRRRRYDSWPTSASTGTPRRT